MTGIRSEPTHVRLTDSTLRDGVHAMAHQFTEEQVRASCTRSTSAASRSSRSSHGDGLGGSSFNYGFSEVDEFELIAAAVDEAQRAKIAVLLLPGLGTVEDLHHARDVGASVARIATHCTEADVSAQHFAAARELGHGDRRVPHARPPDRPGGAGPQARIMVDAGAQCVYVVDSAGALVLGDAQARVQALLDEIGDQAQVGFHGHQNLSLGVANSRARRAGRRPADRRRPVCPRRRRGQRADRDPGGDVRAARHRDRRRRRGGAGRRARTWCGRSSRGCPSPTGRPSSRATPASTPASCCTPSGRRERYGVPAHEILQRVGEAGYVGGQEDMIIDIAIQLAQQQADAVPAEV